jgi:hypothetical protein
MMFMRSVLMVSVLLIAAACAKEEKPAKPTGGGVVAQEGGITSETELPDDKDTRKFADQLVREPVKGFSPADNVRWDTLKFGPKNHWEAATVITLGGEKLECEEAGRWSAEKSDSASKGTITLQTKKTSCPSRSDSTEYRLGLTVAENGWQVVVR